MASREVQITDLLSRASGGDNTAQMTIVIEPRSSGELIIEAEDLTKWSRTTPVYFATFKADESSPNGIMEGSQTNWKGIVNPDNNSIHSLIADTDTPDQGNDIGDYILVLPTARQFNDLHEALSRSFNPDGSLIDGSVTASKIDWSTIGIQSTYVTLGGVKIMFGTASITLNGTTANSFGSTSVTLPTSFTGTNYRVTISLSGDPGSSFGMKIGTNSRTTSSFTAFAATASTTGTASWTAD